MATITKPIVLDETAQAIATQLTRLADRQYTGNTTCTLPTFTEAGSQNVAVAGITSDSMPVLDVYIADSASKDAAQEAWSHIYRADTYNGGITFYSDAAITGGQTILIKSY